MVKVCLSLSTFSQSIIGNIIVGESEYGKLTLAFFVALRVHENRYSIVEVFGGLGA